jgi:hypothetical protein
MPSALIGKEIVVHSVMPPKGHDPKMKILKRPLYLVFSWHSKIRKGEPCVAFINEKISGISRSDVRFLKLENFVAYLKIRLRDSFNFEYDILYEGTKILKCKRILAECCKHKTKSVSTKGFHCKNQTFIHGTEHCALCYEDIIYAEDEKYHIN